MATVVVYTQAGEEKVVNIIDGTASTPADLGTGNSWIGWGTGADTADKSDTVLSTEASEARVGCTVSQSAVDKNTWVSTITADGTKTITNAGVLDAVTSGQLIIFASFDGIPLVLNDAIEFTVDLEQT